jgi:hypothetical protein
VKVGSGTVGVGGLACITSGESATVTGGAFAHADVSGATWSGGIAWVTFNAGGIGVSGAITFSTVLQALAPVDLSQ